MAVMDVTGQAELGATKQDLIAAMVQRSLLASAKVAPTIMDVSRFAVPGSQSISFPFRSNNFVVQKRTSGQKGDQQAITYSKDKLDLGENAFISWIIERFDNIQAQIEAESDAIDDAAKSHARGVDSDIIADMVLNADAANDIAGVAATGITRGNITELIEALDNANVPEDDRTLLIRPKQKRFMLNISDFIDASKFGSSMPIQNGQIGQVFGIPVIVSNLPELGVDEVLMYHREGESLGFQASPNVDEQKAIGFGTGSMLTAMDQLYGFKTMQSGKFISKLTLV